MVGRGNFQKKKKTEDLNFGQFIAFFNGVGYFSKNSEKCRKSAIFLCQGGG